MVRKVEVQIFPETTASASWHRWSLWRVAVVVVAVLLGAGGFWIFDPLSLAKKWTDVDLFKLYAQNKELQKTLNKLESQKEEAHRRLSEAEALRDSVVKVADIPLTANVDPIPVSDEENVPHSIGPARNMKAIRRSHQTFKTFLAELQKNPALARSLPIIQPIKHHNMVTGRFGLVQDHITMGKIPHYGVDFSAPDGDTIIAPGAGMVASVMNERGFGLSITIVHNERTETFYAHLLSALVRPGQTVSRGQPIGLVGRSGRSTGSHLHYEIHILEQPVNPEAYFLTP